MQPTGDRSTTSTPMLLNDAPMPAVALALSAERRGGDAILVLAGELDAFTGVLFVDEALSMLDRLGCDHVVIDVVIDLANLDHLAAGGVHALLSLRSAVLARGGTFRMTGARRIVRHLLEITGTDATLSLDGEADG